MTDNGSILIEQFEGKLRKLMDLYELLKTRNHELSQQIDVKDQEIGRLNNELSVLKESYSTLKQSKVLEVSGHDLDNTKQRIAGLVREIDHCMDLLNSK